MADDAVQGRRLSWLQARGRAKETAGRPAVGDLSPLTQLGQRVGDKAVGRAEGCVLSKDEDGIDQRRQRLAVRVKGQVKVPGLDLAHFGRVARAGAEAVERQPAFQVVHRHPGFESAADLLEALVVHAIGHDAG